MKLKNETHKSLISLKLSQNLKEYTSPQDRIDASEETGVGINSVLNVMRRTNTLTEKNEPAIVALLATATKNCSERPIRDKNALKGLKSMITE